MCEKKNKFCLILSYKNGIHPFGVDFNVRNAPKKINELVKLCIEKIPKNQMPLLIVVGDTVTSFRDLTTEKWMRGGSDRGFLTLIQELGKLYHKENEIIFVNSSNEEVFRPIYNEESTDGITDPQDILEFTTVMKRGPIEYVDWFTDLANSRLKAKIRKL